jgi:glycosyltransferase involved in cell wall biosynthesis
VDAGSTDGSAELLRDYQARHNCFSHLIIEPDQGQSDGLNKGFRLATGEILTWVNSDDMLAPIW